MVKNLGSLHLAVSLDVGAKNDQSNLKEKVKNVNQKRKKTSQKEILKCEICKMEGFRKKDALDRHVADHTGEVTIGVLIKLFTDMIP
jgi:hypothetical protein